MSAPGRFSPALRSGPLSKERVRALPLVPVLAITTLIAAFSLAALTGVFYDHDCGPLHTVAVLLNASTGAHQCRRITFAADLPSLSLGVSATVAAGLYRWSEAAWRSAPDALVKSGVLQPDHAYLFAPHGRIERGLDWLTRHPLSRAFLFLLLLGVGVAFYRITYDSAHLFKDYAQGEGLRPDAVPALKASWWADWHTRPGLAALWILVGSAGVYAATRDLLTFARRALAMRRMSTECAWQHASSGAGTGDEWSPLMQLANIRVWGLVTFLFTLAVLIYLARAQQPGGAQNVWLVSVTLLVVVMTLVPLRVYYRSVQQAHRRAVAREIAGLDAQSQSANPSDYAALSYFVLRRTELNRSVNPPRLSALSSVSRAIVVIVAAASFIASLIRISVG